MVDIPFQMKKFMLFFGALLLGSFSICAQGQLVNNGAQIKATGNVQIVLQNTSWINTNGQFTPGTSTVKFTGTTDDSSFIVWSWKSPLEM